MSNSRDPKGPGMKVTYHNPDSLTCNCISCENRRKLQARPVRNEQTDRERFLAALDEKYSGPVVDSLLGQLVKMMTEFSSGASKATLDQLVSNAAYGDYEDFTMEPSKPSGTRANAAPKFTFKRNPFDLDMSDCEDFEMPPPGMRTNSLTGTNPYSTYNPNGK